MTHTIEVKQEHLNKGKKHKCNECPVALALKDAGFSGVNVTYFSATLNGTYVPLSKTVESYIKAFDADKPVSPFTFQVEFP